MNIKGYNNIVSKHPKITIGPSLKFGHQDPNTAIYLSQNISIQKFPIVSIRSIHVPMYSKIYEIW